jgi:hypothetical protein
MAVLHARSGTAALASGIVVLLFARSWAGPAKKMSPEPESLSVPDTAGLPPDMAKTEPLWEAIDAGNFRSSLRARRLYPDGRVYSYSKRRRVLDQRGLPSEEPGPAKWRLQARIKPEGVAAVRGLLDRAQPADLELPKSQGSVMDGSHRLFRFFAGGQERKVFLDGRRFTPQQVPPVFSAVEKAINRSIIPGGAPMVQD